MADKYWYKAGADSHWDTVTGNWWTDAAHTAQAAAIPVTNDYIYMLGATVPDSAPSLAVTLMGFDTSGLTSNALASGITDGLVTLAPGGTLVIGDPAVAGKSHVWAGETDTVGSFTLNSDASNTGTVGDGAAFTGTACNYGTVGDNATFSGTACNRATGTVGDYATFNSESTCLGEVGNYAVFNDLAYLDTDGVVGDYATFNDAAYSLATVGAYATFNGTGGNYGTAGDYVTINSPTEQDGTWTGATVYVGAAAAFAATCKFTHAGGSVNFILLNSAASVTGAFTSDGGTTPVQVQVTVRPDPKVIII